MKKTCPVIVLLLVNTLFSFAQTSEQVVSLLHAVDNRSTGLGERIVFIEEFNFGIPGGINWLVEWEGTIGLLRPTKAIQTFVYVVDAGANEIIFRQSVLETKDMSIIRLDASHLATLPGRTLGYGGFQIGDFNGEGLDMILDFSFPFGSILPSVDIHSFDPRTGGIEKVFSMPFDKYYEQLPVRFITYNEMQGFMLRFYAGYWGWDGENYGWIPYAGPRAGRWFFFFWDSGRREFVEAGEVNKAGTESARYPIEQITGETTWAPHDTATPKIELAD